MHLKAKQILFLAFVVSPIAAEAHGEQSIYPVLINFSQFVTLTVLLFVLKVSRKIKTLIILEYLALTGLAILIIDHIGYIGYLRNMVLFNSVLVIIPSLVLGATYLMLRNKGG